MGDHLRVIYQIEDHHIVAGFLVICAKCLTQPSFHSTRRRFSGTAYCDKCNVSCQLTYPVPIDLLAKKNVKLVVNLGPPPHYAFFPPLELLTFEE